LISDKIKCIKPGCKKTPKIVYEDEVKTVYSCECGYEWSENK